MSCQVKLEKNEHYCDGENETRYHDHFRLCLQVLLNDLTVQSKFKRIHIEYLHLLP
jgi:hypothetical protein